MQLTKMASTHAPSRHNIGIETALHQDKENASSLVPASNSARRMDGLLSCFPAVHTNIKWEIFRYMKNHKATTSTTLFGVLD
jgi:hypothetical protein